MHEVITRLLAEGGGVEPAEWRELWDRLGAGDLDGIQVAALLAALSVRLPDTESLRGLLDSLHERHNAPETTWPGAVNVVGTGGGPSTFNISTAAAFVAAAMGVPVVKSGSRAYTSSLGSVDLLDRLGVGLSRSYTELADNLAEFGIAFAGHFAYPTELTKLARTLVPHGIRPFGRFLNAIGPLLARLPVAAQVTGVSNRMPLTDLRRLAEGVTSRTVWLCANDLGADELLGFTDNVIHRNDGEPLRLPAGTYTAGFGSLRRLRPANPATAVEHFGLVLAGSAGEIATETVCLNAAALAMAGGHAADWGTAMAAARRAVAEGRACELLERVVAAGAKRLVRVPRAVAHG